jgi:phenylalanyl-tRNA synthetase beta chain
MQLSFSCLTGYVDIHGFTSKQIADKLTQGGIEVERIVRRPQVAGVVVGRVVTKTPHPNASKLNVCTVDVGAEHLLEIVCGAANVAAGQVVPVAKIGAVLPGGIEIRAVSLRGVASQGMICSAQELGFPVKLLPPDMQEGIYVLPSTLPLGADVTQLCTLNDDVFELSVTPNRTDCTCILGVAHEVGALLERRVHGRSVPEDTADTALAIGTTPLEGDVRAGAYAWAQHPYFADVRPARMHIHIDDACAQRGLTYYATEVAVSTTAPMPLWMQQRLLIAGIRLTHPLIDASHYAMLEYGQPLHVYDADTLAQGGQHICIRYAQDGETITTSDGILRTLTSRMVVVTDGSVPIALAGVMGSLPTRVTAQTKRIVVEAATFDPATVRTNARAFGLRSEASTRFEKGLNVQHTLPALYRVLHLMGHHDATIRATMTAVHAVGERAADETPRVHVSSTTINSRLGTTLSSHTISHTLHRLGFTPQHNSPCEEGTTMPMQWHVPRWRVFFHAPIDVCEDIARMHMEDIAATALHGETTPGSRTPIQRMTRTLRHFFSAHHFHEAITYSLTAEQQCDLVATYDAYEGEPVRLAMPMSTQRSVLRTSLLPHLLDVARFHASHHHKDMAFFEIGHVYIPAGQGIPKNDIAPPIERNMVAGIASGSLEEPYVSCAQRQMDFHDISGILEQLFDTLGIAAVQRTPIAVKGYHPGRSADLIVQRNGQTHRLGRLGQVHPALQIEAGIAHTYWFELDLEALCTHAQPRTTYVPLPRYPASLRDLAIVVATRHSAAALLATIKEAGGDLLASARLFDHYEGEPMQPAQCSKAFSLVYRHPDRTCTDEEVQQVHDRIMATLAAQYEAVLR